MITASSIVTCNLAVFYLLNQGVATVITASSIVTVTSKAPEVKYLFVATVITARDSHFFVKKCGKKLNRYSDSVAYVQRVPMVKR